MYPPLLAWLRPLWPARNREWNQSHRRTDSTGTSEKQAISTSTTTRRRPLISTGAAAAVAGCHPTTILRAIERGELEAVRLGRRGDHRVYVEALDRWMHRVGSEEST